MKKLGIVLGVAAVATITGCKDPDYVGRGSRDSQNDVKSVETQPAKTTTEKAEPTQTATPAPAPTEVVEEKSCTCPPGTKHTEPCGCGAPDCACVVEKPQPTPPPAEPEYTVYIVQSGDYLAKISKKYNVTIASIRNLNPSIKGDLIRVGQKLKLPGKIDVGPQTAPEAAMAKAKATKKAAYTPYTGATKEYVVKSGDTLGAIAYGNGINIRQLKELNGLSGDSLRIGQKLKIPANGKAVKAQSATTTTKPVAASSTTKKTETKKAEVAPVVKTAPETVETKQADEVSPAVTEPETNAVPDAGTVSAEAPGTYVVQPGDDLTGLSIAYGVTAAQIRELNNLGENDQLKPGQVIKLPADAQP